VAELPGGKDPDLVISEDGVEAFRAAVDASRSLVAFVLEHLVPEARYRGVEEKKGAAARALPVIAKLSNTIERDHYRAWLADRIGVAEESLREDRSPTSPPRGSDRRPVSSPKRPRAQEVVGAALVQGRLGRGRVHELGPEPFTDPSLHELIAFVCSSVTASWPAEPDPGFADRIWPLIRENQVLAGVVSDLAVFDLTEEELDQEIEDCWKKLWDGRFKDRISEVARQIAQKDAAGDHECLPELQRELDRLKQAVLQPRPAAREHSSIG
jgi:DNA primase